MTVPELTISIVSYNTAADLCACLKSIYDSPPDRSFQVIVVDNGSKDDSVARVRRDFPQAVIIETGENMGYGRANNRALLGLGSRYYAILNSDLVLKAGSLDSCCNLIANDPSVGIVGSALLNPDGTPQMDWAAGELNLQSIAWEQLFLSGLFPKSRIFGDYFRTWWRRDDSRSLPQVCGALMVVRGELFNKIGGFDPRYFMYCEDTDLCKRVRTGGFDCVYLHTAPSIHCKGKSSAGSLRPGMVLEHNRSRIYYIGKYYGIGSAYFAKAIMAIGSILRIVLWTAVGVAKRDKTYFVKAQGYVNVLRGTVLAKTQSS